MTVAGDEPAGGFEAAMERGRQPEGQQHTGDE